MSAKKSAKKTTKPKVKAKAKATMETPPRVRAKGKGGKPFDDSWHRPFLEFYSHLPVLAVACRHVKISRQTYYEHVEKDQSFAKAVEDAEVEGVETVEAMGFHLATVGQARKKFDKGEPVMDPLTGEQYIEYEVDAGLIQFILKNKKAAVYGDKSKVELSGKVELTDEEVVDRGRAAAANILSAMAASVKGSSA